jgi:transcription antitermination factor NusG
MESKFPQAWAKALQLKRPFATYSELLWRKAKDTITSDKEFWEYVAVYEREVRQFDERWAKVVELEGILAFVGDQMPGEYPALQEAITNAKSAAFQWEGE